MFENEIRSDQSECGQWEREGNRSSSVTVVLVAHSAGLDLRAVSDRGVGGELDNSAGVLGIVGVNIQASTDNSSALHDDLVTVSRSSRNAVQNFHRQNVAQVERVEVNRILGVAFYWGFGALERVPAVLILFTVTLVALDAITCFE